MLTVFNLSFTYLHVYVAHVPTLLKAVVMHDAVSSNYRAQLLIKAMP